MRAESRSPSPPPPPPPPLDASGFIYSPFAEAEKSAQNLKNHAEPAAAAGTGRSKGSGPFPFLKKNSRKEPSALHKMTPSPTAKSNRSDDPFANETTPRGDFRTPSSSSKKGSSHKKDDAPARDHYDVLLSGKDYWGLDTSLADDIRSEVNNTESGLRQNHKGSAVKQNRKVFDSDEDIAAPRRGNAAVEDLDEFERLESAASQSARPPPEYKLMKTTDRSLSSSSSSQMAQQLLAKTSAGGAAGHSRLLAQTLAKSKSEQTKRSFAGQGISSFGYKNDDDDDAAANEDDHDDFRATLASVRIPSTAAEPPSGATATATTSASRPVPMKPTSQPLDDQDDDWDAGETANRDHGDGRDRDHDDGHYDGHGHDDDDDMSFKFDDLPLPTAPARQPPLPTSRPAATEAGRAVGGGRLERPSSTLKVDSASVSSATARQGRGRSTAPAHGAQRRTNSAGPRGRSTSVSRGGKAASDGRETETAAGTAKDVEEKLRSLEKELEHYRAENVSIKKLKKQQEQALAETVQRKEEVLKYLENERQRTLAWCAEQRAEVEKEKRAAAKQIRDAKQKTLGTTAPIKTQKAEIEALQATLEKTKATHDTAAKKWKTTENRLYALIHEHADHIENLEKQLMALEENRIALLEFIAQAGLRLPKSLRNKIVSGDTAAAAAASAATTHGVLQSHGGPSGAGAAAAGATKVASGRVSSAAARQQALQRTLQRIHSQQEKQAHRGYVEEVDVEVVDVRRPQRVFDDDDDGDDGDDGDGRRQPTDRDLDEAANGRRASGATRGSLSPKKDSSLEAATFGRRRSSTSSNATTASTLSTAPAAHSARGKAGPTALSMSQKTMRQVSSSWARSSRSSGRYSQTSDDVDHDDEDFDQRDDDDDADDGGDDGDDDDADAAPVDRDDRDEAMLHRDRGEDDAFLQLSQQRNYSGKKAASPLDSTRRAIDSAFADLLQTQLAASSSTAGIADVKSDASSRRTDAAKAPPTSSSTSGGGSGRSEEIRADGSRVVHYSNGTSKEVDAAGNQKVRFANGDQKYTDLKTGTVVYFYAENQTTHTTYADGVELLEFPNGQLERHDPGGRKEVVFPNGSKKVIHPDGLQESIFPDGVRLLEYSDGRREVQRPAGTVHT